MERLSFFEREVKRMRQCVMLLEAVQKPEVELSPWIKAAVPRMRDAAIEISPEYKKVLENGNWVTVAKVFLMQSVNAYLGQVSPCLQLGDNGQLLPGYTSLSLLGVAYFQLYEAITGQVLLRRCRKCGSLFVPRTSRQQFCPCPLEDGYTRSSCENAYNQWIFWARRQAREGKKTVEEIAAMKNRPVEEVREWVYGQELNPSLQPQVGLELERRVKPPHREGK